MLSLIDPSTPLGAGSTGDEKLRHKFDGYLPLMIELRTYVGLCLEKRCETPLEFLEHLGKTEGWALTKDALHNYLKNDGRAVVIFDGLDEIFDSEQRERVTYQIVGFANDYPKTRIIVTSRVIGYQRKILTDAGFTHFTLQDLDEKQVETFVNRWYDLAMSNRPEEAKERQERILKSFKDSSSIRQLAGNPMLLTIMAIIGKHQELPRERWKLYDHAASVLIQHWDVNKHLKDQRVKADFIGEDDKKELLRRLAYKMQGAEGGLAGNYIHCDQLQAEFEGYLTERYNQTLDLAKVTAEAMIKQFRERNFILSLYGANLYGFVHRAFLEYFCASAFVRKFEKTKDLTIEQLKQDFYGKHWEDQSWHEVLRLICGMIDEKWTGKIIEYLITEAYQQWSGEFDKRLPWNIALAIQCISEVHNLNTVSGSIDKVLESIFVLFKAIISREYSFKFDTFLNEQIITAVKPIVINWPTEQKLVSFLNNLASLGFSSSYARSLSYYSKSFGKFVAQMACGRENIRVLLLGNLSRNETYLVLVPFMLALGWREEPQTFLSLRELASIDGSEWVRCVAIEALAEQFNDEPQTLSLLRDHATTDTSGWVRNKAIEAIAEQFRDKPQTLTLLLDRAINDEHDFVRTTAVFEISEQFRDEPQTLPLLRDWAVNNPNDYVRRAAVAVLGRDFRNEPRTLPLLREFATADTSEGVRNIAVMILARVFREDVQTLPLLQDRAVIDDSPFANDKKDEELKKYVRETAINAIAKYWPDHPDTLPLLEDRAKNDPTPWLRERANELIKELTEAKKKA